MPLGQDGSELGQGLDSDKAHVTILDRPVREEVADVNILHTLLKLYTILPDVNVLETLLPAKDVVALLNHISMHAVVS